MMVARPVSATGSVCRWNSATPSSVSAKRMKSTGIPSKSTGSITVASMLGKLGSAGVALALVQRLQPVADFASRDIGLVQQFTHGEEAVELARKSPIRHRHAGFLEAFCVFVAFVAQG